MKAFVFKEMCKLSLRYAEGCSSTYFDERIPKSTLSYWEVNYGFLVRKVLMSLLGVLCLLNYDYAVLYSTKFTDWHKALYEAFPCIRVSLGDAFSPFTRSLRPLRRSLWRAFDAKPALNSLALKGYIPIVKPGKLSPGGYGARIRDRLFDESIYRLRGVGEGVFGALTVEFGDRIKTRRKESGKTRLLLRLAVYCLRVL